ncbi:hypothetical protein PGTUg99_006512 [Puccinia graminis f. sp. tritici]|uniref:Uncharacterized protein n=1 Tax=Puccinia graminis f. sp. tritici TaxID=56615 RepID=A0A5B0NVZ7_PUCGR|nr:hypothetical protein PGTUg99_006512 [Puccinia graminis f. sp. tritici]
MRASASHRIVLLSHRIRVSNAGPRIASSASEKTMRSIGIASISRCDARYFAGDADVIGRHRLSLPPESPDMRRDSGGVVVCLQCDSTPTPTIIDQVETANRHPIEQTPEVPINRGPKPRSCWTVTNQPLAVIERGPSPLHPYHHQPPPATPHPLCFTTITSLHQLLHVHNLSVSPHHHHNTAQPPPHNLSQPSQLRTITQTSLNHHTSSPPSHPSHPTLSPPSPPPIHSKSIDAMHRYRIANPMRYRCIASLNRCDASVSLKRVSLKRCDTDTGRFIASYRIVSSLLLHRKRGELEMMQ